MPDRKILTDISSKSWEHPADRAALNALRALPMFDEVVRKVMGFFGDVGVRQLFLANAVLVGPEQRTGLNELYEEVLTAMNCPTRPQLYVKQTPEANAIAVGFDEPFVVINSGALTLLNREEQRFLLAHEVGHIMSGHVVYRTLAAILLLVGMSGLPFLAGLALLPIQVGLLEWYRKSELSADRAGLLGSQSRDDTLMAFLKLAGGASEGDKISLDEFMKQASSYETQNGAREAIMKVLNTVFREHPFNTVRAAELQRWIDSGAYDKVLAGEYIKRSDPTTERPLNEDFQDAAGYYGDEARAAFGKLGDVFDRAKGAFDDAFKGAPALKVLIVGGGAREHALGWKLLHDDPSLEIIAAPGNPGLAAIGRCEDVAADDIAGLAALARREEVAFTVIGPEGPLDAGIVDLFRARGLAVFGPSKAAARIETSKRFAKELMLAAKVPTADARTFTNVADAVAAAERLGAPVVIKASGLAAGKGVIVATTIAEARDAIESMLEGNIFGDAGHEVLVEEFLTGEEISVFALTDGTHVLPMIGAQDHKRVGEGDTGPNTGGMGAYAPVSIATAGLAEQTIERVFIPTLTALREAGSTFTGLLYAGLMLTSEGQRVIEFNCRFGDPETETLLPLMASGLLEPMRAIANGDSIAGAPAIEWRPGASVTTVVASNGYPGTVESGFAITLPPAEPDVLVFHAGTRRNGAGELATAGGRVLAVTALGATLTAAQRTSASYASRVQFEGRQYRGDIGWRDLSRR